MAREKTQQKHEKLQPLQELPKPPAGLGTFGNRAWREIGGQLVKAQILTELNLYLLAEMAKWYKIQAEVEKQIKKFDQSQLFTSTEGNRLIAARQQAHNNLFRMFRSCGITPNSLLEMGKHGGSSIQSDQPLAALRRQELWNNAGTTKAENGQKKNGQGPGRAK